MALSLLVTLALLGSRPASAQLSIGSTQAQPGQTATVSISLAGGSTSTGLDITLQATGPVGAPALQSPSFSRSAATSGWATFNSGNAWRYIVYDGGALGTSGPVELLTLSVTVDPSTPRGTVYTLSASSVELTDGEGNPITGSGIVSSGQISVPNAVPVATPQSVTTAEGTAKSITLAGTDGDGDALTYAVASQPGHGALSGTPPNLTYTPSAGYSGSDSFAFTVSDGVATSAPATVGISITPVNDPPTADPKQATTAEDTPVAVTLSGSDPESAPLTYTIVTAPAHGSLSGTAPGLTYTPAANYHGTDSFTYRVSDGTLSSEVATVSLTVTSVNDAPVLSVPGPQAGVEGQPVSFSVSASDADGDSVTLSASGLPAGASFSGGAFSWTPSFSQAGQYTVACSASDGQGGTDARTVSLDISNANRPPTAESQAVSTPEDTPAAVTLAGSDPDGEPLTFSVTAQPAHGTLSGAAPDLTYTPAANFHGSDSFRFRAGDGAAASDEATVTIAVTSVNDPPVAMPDSLSVVRGSSATLQVLANDSDADGDALAVTQVTAAAHGSVVLNANGTVTYTPQAGYLGADSFTYTVSDGQGGSASAAVSLTVLENAPPVGVAQSVTTGEDTSVAVTLSATDAEGAPLTYAVSRQPAHGTLTGQAPNVTYTPARDYNGADSFAFTASDGVSSSQPATVSITVTPANDAPTATGQQVLTAEDTPATILLTGSDVDGDSLTYSVSTAPAHGTLLGTAPNLTYTPAANYNGADSFAFTVSDGSLTSSPALVSLTVTPVNDAPVAVNDQTTLPKGAVTDVTVLLNDSDPDGDPLTVTGVSQGAHGTVTLGQGGAVRYAPAADYAGADSFTYTLSDGHGGMASASVSVTVLDNRAPRAESQQVSTRQDTGLTITLTGTDPDGDSLTFSIAGHPAHGTLSGAVPNVLYTPSAGYRGSDSFSFRVSDGRETSPPATVSITVVGNDAPVATPQSVTTPEDTPKAITLSGTDAQNDALTYTVVTSPQHGSLSGKAPNLTYTPARDYHGADSFTFRASDGRADSAPATVAITVAPVNDPPTLTVPVAQEAQAGSLLSFRASATDPEGDPLTFSAISLPPGASFSSDGEFRWTPAADQAGTHSAVLRVRDGQGGVDSRTVALLVLGPTSGPVARGDAVTTDEDTPLAVPVADLLANDLTDAESGPLSLPAAAAGDQTHGSVMLAEGVVAYTPDPDYSGTASFTYTLRDARGRETTGTVVVTVRPVNDPPLALDSRLSTPSGAPLTVELQASDVDSPGLTYTVVSAPSHGTLGPVAGGRVTYTPGRSYVGVDSFTFRANDGTAQSRVATVRVIVGSPGPIGALLLGHLEGRPGQALEVPVTGQGLQSLTGVSFDVEPVASDGAPALEVEKVLPGDGLQGATATVEARGGRFAVTVSGAAPTAGQGVLAVLLLRVPDTAAPGATYALNLHDALATLRNGDGTVRDVVPAQTGGTLTVLPRALKGDPTGDRAINIGDVLLAIRLMLRLQTPTPDQLYSADLNDDGVVSIADVVRLLRMVLRIPG